jgi:recombination protein RecT
MENSTLAVKTVIGVLQKPAVVARFKEVLGNRAPKFVSSIISAVNMTPALRKCDPDSVISAAMIAASIDIPINQSLGFAYIIPYGNLAQFQLGAKGFVQLAERTGQYKTINVSDVYKDEFKSWDPITGTFEYHPISKRKMRDDGDVKNIVGYVAYFKTLNGFEKWLYMSIPQLIDHGKKYSKSFATGQWTKDPPAMYSKTVVKLLLSKWGMMSIDIQGVEQLEKALSSDQAVIDIEGVPEFPDNAVTADPLDERRSSILKRFNDLGFTKEQVEDVVGTYELTDEEKLDGLEKILKDEIAKNKKASGGIKLGNLKKG